MADRYLADDGMNLACELLFVIVDTYPGAAEAVVAHNRLMTIAERYERAGAGHRARGIYERLLRGPLPT